MAQPIVGVQVDGLRLFARDLKAANRAQLSHIRRAMRQASQVVADEVKVRTSWSSRIPATVHATGGIRSANVRWGGVRAPHAAPNEQTSFRHPVFGHRDRRVAQQGHPAGVAALAATADQVADVLADALLDVFRDAGYR